MSRAVSAMFSNMTQHSAEKASPFVFDSRGELRDILIRFLICIPLSARFLLNQISTTGERLFSCSNDLLPTCLLNNDVSD